MAGTSQSLEDERYLLICLELAADAGRSGEVPVGAIVVLDGTVIGRGANRTVAHKSPLEHAEMVALEDAFRTTGDPRIPGAVLYCSLEPCFMCTGAALHARVARIAFSTRDPKFGACGSLAMLPTDPRLNHRCEVTEGLCAAASADLLRSFFKRLR